MVLRYATVDYIKIYTVTVRHVT